MSRWFSPGKQIESVKGMASADADVFAAPWMVHPRRTSDALLTCCFWVNPMANTTKRPGTECMRHTIDSKSDFGPAGPCLAGPPLQGGVKGHNMK